MNVLVANIGSTSFKYRLFRMPDETVLAQGAVERIGQPGSEFSDYGSAIAGCLEKICGEGRPLASLSELSAVGFKAVHAGPLTGAQIVNDQVLAAMEEFSFLAPAHNPPYIAAMRSFRAELPQVRMVALFETAFYEALDKATTTYAVPYEWCERCGVRRYGFHGASHRFASEWLQEKLGRKDLRHISCHLGGSSSVAAIRSGVAIDTSFGMSPQSGLPQGRRVGDIDAFAVLFMMKRLGIGVDEMASLLAGQSGLAGASGTSGDVRDLANESESGNERARLALEVFVRSIRHYIGAFLVELGGLDVLTFSGGIGENSVEVRKAVCRGLGAFGIELDEARNQAAQRGATISTSQSSCRVLVVPTNEEIVVARAATEAVQQAESRKKTEAASTT
ncbi:MAG: acetate/propionate family kinase [Acidobacteriota bacterium]